MVRLKIENVIFYFLVEIIYVKNNPRTEILNPFLYQLKCIFLKEYIMTENDTLHLWFKPYEQVLGEADIAFIDRYCRRFYPRAMGELTKRLHKLVAKITQLTGPNVMEYSLQHYSKKATKRYILEESLRDTKSADGLSISIQSTTPDERRLFSECFTAEQTETGNTQPVQNVVSYLEDSLESESHKWENAKIGNGQDALPILMEIIEFLKQIKNHVRVYHFEVTQTQRGIELTLAMLSPGVLSYYTRIDWVIA